jgi:hypothetical protein
MGFLASSDSEQGAETKSRSILVFGVLAAMLITALVFTGYSFLRKRHQQKVSASLQAQASPTPEPKGPPKAQILVDDALLKGGQTLLGGTVKNISTENLSDLVVDLELIRRKDSGTERVSAPVDPRELGPQQEGRYAVQLHAADYLSVRLAGLKSGSNSALLSYVAGAGQKRPPERFEGKTIVVGHPNSSKGGFLNTPDNPGRVP